MRQQDERRRHDVALGLRAHSGWAALVALAGPAHAPRVVDRRRLEMTDASLPGAAQPYHAAEGRRLPEAERLIERFQRSAQTLAAHGFGAALADLRRDGYEVAACGILLASGRSGATLGATLASHALIHTADGEHFRDALRHAARSHDLEPVGIREKELGAHASQRLRRSDSELKRALAELGKGIGPPWTQDQKLAALLAWTLLCAS